MFAPQSAGEAAEQYNGDWVDGMMLGRGVQLKQQCWRRFFAARDQMIFP